MARRGRCNGGLTMTGFPLCDIEFAKQCPERFRSSASEWIDQSNFGDLPDGKLPPAGIRLRWNWPLLADSAAHTEETPAFPDRFAVCRYGPIHDERLMKPLVTVGHLPRMYAPKSLWKNLMRAGDRDLVVGVDPCSMAQAIHIVMAPHSERVSIALVDVTGETRLVGELVAGDCFYYELGDIQRVVFSAPPKLVIAQGLSLTAEAANAADIGFARIATVDARAWLNAALVEVSERMASDQLPPFTTINDQEWEELQQRGRDVITALATETPPLPLDINYLQLGIATRWEIASLVGWGFLDGEHVAAPRFDRIDRTAMLTPASHGIYAYQIVAEFDASDRQVRSDIALTFARPMPALTPATIQSLAPPVTRSELINYIDQFAAGETPQAFAAPIERTRCMSNWQITVRAPYAQRVFTSPRASDSQINPNQVDIAGEFSADGLRRPVIFRGMERIELRDHSFPVPFYDSDIWLLFATGDYWDRRVAHSLTPPIQPEIDYRERCIGLSGGTTNSALRTVQVNLDLVSNPSWTADTFSTFARGTIELLIKCPELDELAIDVILYAASPTPGGNWRAIIETDLTVDELWPFIGGTVSADGFRGLILGFAPEQRRRFRCEFESIAVCAGAPLYSAGPNGVAATLYEAEGSDRVWSVGKTIPLLLDGSPGSPTGTIKLPELETSMLLYCSTRLRVEFEGKTYRGPLTPRIGVPYIHPAPKPPELCFDIRTLAVDYYGRAVVRAEVSACERFDPVLTVSLQAVTGLISDPSDFASSASKGLFGSQTPIRHRVVFDAFELLGHQPDGTVNTLGIRYVRASDGRESKPDLQPFGSRRTN